MNDHHIHSTNELKKNIIKLRAEINFITLGKDISKSYNQKNKLSDFKVKKNNCNDICSRKDPPEPPDPIDRNCVIINNKVFKKYDMWTSKTILK